MMKRIETVAVITNYNITEKANAAMDVADYLLDNGCKVNIFLSVKDKLQRLGRLNNECTFLDTDEVYKRSELLIVLGGDGTILEVSRRAAITGTPILGINLGRLGYMTELEMEEIRLLNKLVEGDYDICERVMLSVAIIDNNGKYKLNSFALNDAVISNGSVARIVDVELRENGEPVSTYRADGLIVATPTGSTAYSMSAGGAIVDPRLSCLCVTPICPHSLSARPLIFPDSAILEIKNICVREKNLFLTIDGRTNYELYRGETVRITKSEKVTRLITLKDRSFYNILRQKMSNNH